MKDIGWTVIDIPFPHLTFESWQSLVFDSGDTLTGPDLLDPLEDQTAVADILFGFDAGVNFDDPFDGSLSFSGIPSDETTTMRIFDLTGEIVLEAVDVRGAKSWDGRNRGAQIVEPGVYLVTAESTTPQGVRKTYRGKVAILR